MNTWFAVLALVALVGCATPEARPDDTPEPPAGAAIDTDVVDAATAAGFEPCPDAEPTGPLAGVELTCLTTGEDVSLGSFAGTPTLVNAWASWCEPCREELPLLARAAREYEGRVRFVGLVFADGAPLDAIDLAAASEVGYTQLADPRSLARTPLRLRALPQSVFLSADGTIAGTEHVAFTDYDQLTDAIDRHLGVKP